MRASLRRDFTIYTGKNRETMKALLEFYEEERNSEVQLGIIFFSLG